MKEQIEALQAFVPVFTSDVNDLLEALQMILSVGELTGKNEEAHTLVTQTENNFSKLAASINEKTSLRCAYFIWREPYMVAGGDTFINDMLKRSGFINVFEPLERYPQISLEQLQQLDCQIIFLSSEPFPFKKEHAEEIKEHVPAAQVLLVDGELFSWYGSRLLLAPQYFEELMLSVKRMRQ